MNTSYAFETIARQRLDETARLARTAHERRRPRVRTGWRFPKVTFPTRPRVTTIKPA